MSTQRELLEQEIKELRSQSDILSRQIDNNNKNVTGLVEQGLRYLNRRDLTEQKLTAKETELANLPEDEAGV